MKRSSNTPATFIAIPWTPVGRPKRNSARMMPQSGRQSMPRCHTTGSRPDSNRYTAVPLMTSPATVVPTAAPAVPRRGRGPRPVMNATLHAMFNTVRRIPRRIGVRASPAARSAPPTMKNSSIPMLPTNMMRRNGNASWRTAGAALTTPSSDGARTQPSEEGLVHGAIDLLAVVGAGEAGHQHAHPAEHRHDEHDHDNEDLDRDADGGVAGVPHEVTHQGVIDDALQPADEVLQHRGPGDHPHGVGDRALDDGAVEGLGRRRGCGHGVGG